MAAIEAAILLPLLCLVAVILIDTVRYITTTARIDRVAAVTGDLIARSQSVVDRTDFANPTLQNELGMFFLAANEVAMPDDLAAEGRIIVTSVTTTPGGYAANWQRSGPYGYTARSRLGALPPLPLASTYIVTEVFLVFRPAILELIGVLSAADTVIYRRTIFRPRLTALATLEPA